jgi:hypothetical protein
MCGGVLAMGIGQVDSRLAFAGKSELVKGPGTVWSDPRTNLGTGNPGQFVPPAHGYVGARL